MHIIRHGQLGGQLGGRGKLLLTGWVGFFYCARSVLKVYLSLLIIGQQRKQLLRLSLLSPPLWTFGCLLRLPLAGWLAGGFVG